MQGGDQALRAAVLGRSGQQIAGTYLGKGHTMYAQPMGYFSWTVVVFRNKDYLRTTFCEILTLCLLLSVDKHRARGARPSARGGSAK